MYTLSLKTTRISNLSLHHHQESTDIIRYYGMIISQQTFLVRSFPSLKRSHVPPPPHLFQQFFLLRGKGQAFPERCLIIVRGRQSWSWPRARFAFIKRKRPSPRKIRPWKISPSSGELHFSSLNRRCERDARVHNDSPQDWSTPFISNLLRRISGWLAKNLSLMTRFSSRFRGNDRMKMKWNMVLER